MSASILPPLPPVTSRRDFMKLLGGGSLLALPLPAFAGIVPPSPAKPRVPAAGFYPFRIGELDAWIISDGGFPSPVHPVWDTNASESQVQEALRAAFLPTDHLWLDFNVLVVRVGADLVMVDSGAGSLFGPAGGRLVSNLRAAGLTPEDITVVILSHAHPDHFGGLADLDAGELNFPNAHLFIPRTEFDFWTSPAPDRSRQVLPQADKDFLLKATQRELDFMGARFAKVEPGQKIVDGIELVAAPGHTPGHCAILVSSGNEQLLHAVDTVNLTATQMQHPDWSIGYDTDPGLAGETRRKIFARAAADRTRLLTYHLPFPGLGHVRTEGNAYAWVPEPWSWQ